VGGVASNVVPAEMARIFSLVADQGAIKEARRALSQISTSDRIRRRPGLCRGQQGAARPYGPRRRNPRPPRLPLPAAQDAAALALVRRFGLAWPTAASSRRRHERITARAAAIRAAILPRACLIRDCVRRCCMRPAGTIADTVTSVFGLNGTLLRRL